MQSYVLAAGVFAVVFAGGAIGLQLQRSLPEDFTTGGPRDMVGAVVGLVTLLLALVLGLLIWTSFGVYSAQKASIQSMAISDLKFNTALAEYGPEAAPGRQILKSSIERTISHMWAGVDDGDFVVKNYNYAMSNLKERETFLKSLQASTDKQKAAQADALQAAYAIDQSRLQMALALVDPISYPLLGVVIAWATCLFCGYGLLSKSHVMAYIALFAGALAVASAINVIIDLSDPYAGLFQVSQTPLLDVIKAIDASAK